MKQSKKKILLADDDPAILDVLTLLLEEFGYEIDSMSDEIDLHYIENNHPDLLLLDIWMSGWSGSDLCLSLKSQQKTQHIPIILISANNDVERIAREARADDFLAKPFELNDVLQKVEHYLA